MEMKNKHGVMSCVLPAPLQVAQMSTMHHPNLVRLLGFAVGGDVHTRVENVLVYEFIPNGDLERWMGQ
ncbi:unnamed protein product, partial [Closterium sp. NIES-54]